MDKATYTKGPWDGPHFARDDISCNCTSVVSEGYAGAIATIHFDNGKTIDDGGNGCPPLEEAKANARLIAAAPQMFEALQNILLCPAILDELNGDSETNNAVAKARAALSKALGEGQDSNG